MASLRSISWGEAFKEALPFTALLGVFWVVAVIHAQQLFGSIIHYVLAMDGDH